MNHVLFYFSGSGNSLWTAKVMSENIPLSRMVPMASKDALQQAGDADAIGLIFSVHIWGLPRLVLDFVGQLKELSPKYLYAVAVNAGQVSRTLVQLNGVCSSLGLELSSGIGVKLASNYIPWGGPGPSEEIHARIDASKEKLTSFAQTVVKMEKRPLEKGPLWQRILFTLLYKMSLGQVPVMDKKFSVDPNCDGCSTCVHVCPVQNITLEEKHPRWHHHCEQCLACLHWCPKAAIQMGPKTVHYQRYHHPEVTLKDMLRK